MFGQRGNKACFLYSEANGSSYKHTHIHTPSFSLNAVNCNFHWIIVFLRFNYGSNWYILALKSYYRSSMTCSHVAFSAHRQPRPPYTHIHPWTRTSYATTTTTNKSMDIQIQWVVVHVQLNDRAGHPTEKLTNTFSLFVSLGRTSMLLHSPVHQHNAEHTHTDISLSDI